MGMGNMFRQGGHLYSLAMVPWLMTKPHYRTGGNGKLFVLKGTKGVEKHQIVFFGVVVVG